MIQKIRRKLKFPSCFVVSPMGLAGGMVVFWNDQVSLRVEQHTIYFIDMSCTDALSGNPM